MAQKYKFFSDKEVKGLDPYLCALLDRARELAGFPFIITSGLRTPAQNKKAGGASASLHLKGAAVDISCKDDCARFKMVKAAMEAGFKRIEVAPRHVHLDLGDSEMHPSNILWIGTDG